MAQMETSLTEEERVEVRGGNFNTFMKKEVEESIEIINGVRLTWSLVRFWMLPEEGWGRLTRAVQIISL